MEGQHGRGDGTAAGTFGVPIRHDPVSDQSAIPNYCAILKVDDSMTDTIDQLLETLEAAAERKKFHKIDFFKPYAKQRLFFDLGSACNERLLMAGNQNGKSEAGSYEAALHLTGLYPADWLGKVFRYPTRGWAAGESSTVVRDVQQKKLCGPPGVDVDFGSGMVPRSLFVDKPSLARGVTDAFDTIQVKHFTDGVHDGTSTLSFKSYEQGRTKFQGDSVDFIWPDEEPPEDVYQEMLARTIATNGIVFTTFTPLKGSSNVVLRFTNEHSPDRALVTMTIDDALHISKEERVKIVARFLPHEREARARGVPMLGSGKVFIETEANISEPLLEHIPSSWAKLWGIDFGIGHPFAAVLGAWDKDNDVIHILHCVRIADKLPLFHAEMMKPIGVNVPVAWPQDGTNRDKGTGVPLADAYRSHGLKMLHQAAMWEGGGNSTEAGIIEMQQRFATGRLRIANHLSDWFEEYRLYHRKDGQIVKLRDDLMSATRILVMAKRFAQAVPLGGFKKGRSKNAIASGMDFDYFQ
ncbi:MAG: terminase family protein [Negativicutes bacterium]|nr:terminase family protein [Negativicutes bacterium]